MGLQLLRRNRHTFLPRERIERGGNAFRRLDPLWLTALDTQFPSQFKVHRAGIPLHSPQLRIRQAGLQCGDRGLGRPHLGRQCPLGNVPRPPGVLQATDQTQAISILAKPTGMGRSDGAFDQGVGQLRSRFTKRQSVHVRHIRADLRWGDWLDAITVGPWSPRFKSAARPHDRVSPIVGSNVKTAPQASEGYRSLRRRAPSAVAARSRGIRVADSSVAARRATSPGGWARAPGSVSVEQPGVGGLGRLRLNDPRPEMGGTMRATKASMSITTVTLLVGGLRLLAGTHGWSSPTVDRLAWEHDLNVLDRPRTDLGQLEDFTRNLCGQSEESLAVYLAVANNPEQARTVMTINSGMCVPRTCIGCTEPTSLPTRPPTTSARRAGSPPKPVQRSGSTRRTTDDADRTRISTRAASAHAAIRALGADERTVCGEPVGPPSPATAQACLAQG